jgi:hypothetical protein
MIPDSSMTPKLRRFSKRTAAGLLIFDLRFGIDKDYKNNERADH